MNGIVTSDPRLPCGGITCSGHGHGYEPGPLGICALADAQQVRMGAVRTRGGRPRNENRQVRASGPACSCNLLGRADRI
ncbi:hypothetical protein C1N80_11235 [Brachybacterium sp. SGAir0954]|nr:hypothetical protein C1N80_11235 [Brachybacterium sp. SGAir0954]